MKMFNVKSGLIALLVSSTLAAPVVANGTSAQLPSVMAKAVAGDRLAQAKLGYMYKVGNGVQRDVTASEAWYAKSIENLNPQQIFELAGEYWTGSQKIDRNPTQAYKLYVLSAEKGSIQAKYTLASRYEQTHFLWENE